MSFSGIISTYPTPDLLQWLSHSRKTGTISFVSGEHKTSLIFRDGLLVTASSSDASRRLGQFLLARELITEAQLAEVLELQAAGGAGTRLGQILTERGYLTEEQIAAALTDSVREIVYDLFLLDEASFHFDPEDAPPASAIAVPLDLRVEPLLLEGAQRLGEWNRYRQVVPSDRAWVMLVPDPVMQPGLSRLPLS